MSSVEQTNLSKKMRKFAVEKGFAGDHELIDLAYKLDVATNGFYSEPQAIGVKQFMGCWARARKAWCTHSGEALV